MQILTGDPSQRQLRRIGAYGVAARFVLDAGTPRLGVLAWATARQSIRRVSTSRHSATSEGVRSVNRACSRFRHEKQQRYGRGPSGVWSSQTGVR